MGCSWMAANSSSVSGPSFRSTVVGTPELAHIGQHHGVEDRLHPAGPHADLPADHDRAPRDPLPVTTGVEVLGLHRLAQGRHRGRVRALLAAGPRCEPRSAAHGDADVA